MRAKKVLDVGNCRPDHAAISKLLVTKFAAEVFQTHAVVDTLATLKSDTFDLVLINRKLDQDYSDGIEILKLIKADESISNVPVMLITNYDEHQQTAEAEGALRGFGKLELDSTETFEKLSSVLS